MGLGIMEEVHEGGGRREKEGGVWRIRRGKKEEGRRGVEEEEGEDGEGLNQHLGNYW